MRSSLFVLLGLVALASADYGSHEFRFNYGSPRYSSSESRESSEESGESGENKLNGHPSFYTKDVIHGMGPHHSLLTVDFPQPKFPQPYKPDFPQHFGAPKQVKEEAARYHDNAFGPRYGPHGHEQYQVVGKPYAKQSPKPQVSVVKTDDGKKIMTMTKPGYKMVVEEMEDDKNKMIGRSVKETKSTKDEGDDGETMHQSQSYQYQVVQSESSGDKEPRTHVRSDSDLKDIDFSRFAQPQKDFKRNFPSEFQGQYGYQQHQEFVKAQQQQQQQQNPYGFQGPKAFDGLRIPPGIRQHLGF